MFLRRILPGALLAVAAALGWFVFVFAPARLQREFAGWWFSHTEAARWQERASAIRRWGWVHDDADDVGRYGGKDWAAWIMARMDESHDLSKCREGHKEGALRMITNHAPPLLGVKPATGGRDRGPWPEQAAWWKQWWKAHRADSQEEWVRQGFAAVGIEIQDQEPLSQEAAEKLLALIGRRSDRPTVFKPKVIDAATLQPEKYLRYNAMRWLRDSGFDVAAYAVEKITPATPADVKQGVKDYFDMRLTWLEEMAPGRLFGKREAWYEDPDRAIPDILLPRVRRMAAVLVILLPLVAWWLWSRPRKESAVGKTSPM